MTTTYDMLVAAGIPYGDAAISVPFMFMRPRTTDPYAAGVIQIVRGLQMVLRGRGARIAVDGSLGPDTAAAIERYTGPGLLDIPWWRIYQDVLTNAPVSEAPAAGMALSGFDPPGGVLPWVLGGVAAYLLFSRSR